MGDLTAAAESFEKAPEYGMRAAQPRLSSSWSAASSTRPSDPSAERWPSVPVLPRHRTGQDAPSCSLPRSKLRWHEAIWRPRGPRARN